MDWFLFVSFIMATPLFAADTLHSLEVERAEVLESRRARAPDQRPPIRLDQVRSMATEIQAKRDARLGEAHEVRISTVKEMMFRLEVAPYVRGRAPRPRRKVHSNFLPKVSK